MGRKIEAEFEEKEFESQINSAIKEKHNFIYAPGQVFEKIIGIDAAYFSENEVLWQILSGGVDAIFPLQRVPGGILLNPTYWDNIEIPLDRLPPFQLNLFLQHKRPTYLSDARSSEWSFWKRPYYRYHLRAHQQLALEKLAAIAKNEALVGYACPAFHTYRELWERIKLDSIISSTNFVNAEKLSGHDAYTYVDAGIKGAACSEPIEVEGFDFINELSRRSDFSLDMSNSQIVIRLGKFVDTALKEAGLQERYQIMLSLASDDIAGVGLALIKISAFCQITNSRWMIGLKL